jgi:hypothetical protein
MTGRRDLFHPPEMIPLMLCAGEVKRRQIVVASPTQSADNS